MSNGEVKKEYSSEEVKVLIDINNSLTNISNSLVTMKETMDDISEMEQKHGTDLQLFNERMKFLQGLYNTLSTVTDDIKGKLSMLTTQLDYGERKELQKEVLKRKEKEKNIVLSVTSKKTAFGNIVKWFADNFKWIVILAIVITIIILLIYCGPDMFKAVLKWYVKN